MKFDFSIKKSHNECVLFFYCKWHNVEVRQEAVQQALAALKNRPKPSLPMPSKRSSVLNRSPDRTRDDTGKKEYRTNHERIQTIRKRVLIQFQFEDLCYRNESE